jgi:hypothetical protein
MNPIRDWVETILRLAREQAEFNEFDRRVQRLLFLFAIEIGRGRKLTPAERELYAKSMLTAEAFLAVMERHPPHSYHRISQEQILNECVSDWQTHEPKLRRLLERMMGMHFQALDSPVCMLPEMRDMFESQFRAISNAFPDQLPPSELRIILERLDHPLDRA